MLILVPYQTQEDDVDVSDTLSCNRMYLILYQVVIERSHLLAGIRGQQPVLKVGGSRVTKSFNHVFFYCRIGPSLCPGRYHEICVAT